MQMTARFVLVADPMLPDSLLCAGRTAAFRGWPNSRRRVQLDAPGLLFSLVWVTICSLVLEQVNDRGVPTGGDNG